MTLFRLPGDLDPQLLPEGTRVCVTHPDHPTEFTVGPVKRELEVISTRWHAPGPSRWRPDHTPKPRLFVSCRLLTRPAFRGQTLAWYWANELSLIVP